LGLNPPIASLAGEIIPKNGVYSYEAKYIDKDVTKIITPAPLPKLKMDELRKLAIRSFEVLCCSGMARVDFLMDENEKLFVNEINTLPGFTTISLYPKLWEISGLSRRDLIDHLIDIAFAQHKQKQVQTERLVLQT